MPATLGRTNAVHTVMFNSDLLPTVCGGMSITGPIQFSAWVDTSAKGKQSPELTHVWLTPGGTNHNLSDEQIATLKKSEIGKEWLSKGVLKIISPEKPDEASGTTGDHDEQTALSIVRGSDDTEWLANSEKHEQRPVVREGIQNQQAIIEERLTALRERANAANN